MKSLCLTFPPCIICNGKASGLHFGCNTCEACKNFFRRYLIRKEGYVCSKQNDCDITVDNKSKCPACRLAKFLQFGMCKTKSQRGRYSNSRRTNTILKAKELEEGPVTRLRHGNDSLVPFVSPKTHLAKRVNSQAMDNMSGKAIVAQLIQNMVDIKAFDIHVENEEERNAVFREYHEKYMNKVKMFGSMNAVPMEEYRVLLIDHGIDIDGYFETQKRVAPAWEDLYLRYCDFAKKIPGFTQLCETDQMRLLKATNFFFFTILMHRTYSFEYNIFIEVNGEAYHYEECCDKFVSRDCVEAACKVFANLQKLELTKEEMALLGTIATFSSDLCKLENPELVDNLQLGYAELLSKHLKAKLECAKASVRFAKLLDSLTRMRELSSIYNKEMKMLCQNEAIIKSLPVIQDLIPEEV